MRYYWIILVFLAAFFSLDVPGKAANKEDVEKLLTTGECKKCDLRNANLRGLKFDSANLESADLRGAKLTDIKANIFR